MYQCANCGSPDGVCAANPADRISKAKSVLDNKIRAAINEFVDMTGCTILRVDVDIINTSLTSGRLTRSKVRQISVEIQA